MSTATPNQPDNKEEIDLGVLFNAIGNGISKLFNAISSTILFILNGVLTFVVFIREKIVYYAIACGVGLAIGIAFEVFIPKEYSGSSTVQPYFDSARQLYSNINYLDGLAAQKDSIQLSRFFGISPKEAASINSVEITPFISQIKSRQAYNKYVTGFSIFANSKMVGARSMFKHISSICVPAFIFFGNLIIIGIRIEFS